MKRTMSLVARDESGKILIMVLVLLVVGALLLTPLLGLMSTGLTAGQVYEKKMAALYACDAGVDDAIWRLVYTIEGLPDEPYPLSRQVNGMDVSVEKMDEREEDEGVIVYTVRSTATRDGELAGQVVAELMWQPLPMVEGSSPGKWLVPSPYPDVLTTLDHQTIAFGMQLGAGTPSKFHAANDEEAVDFHQTDLLALDLLNFTAWLWFAGEEEYNIARNIDIGDAHYYTEMDPESGLDYEYLLMSFKSWNSCFTVGTNNLHCNANRDIVRIRVDPADPARGEADIFLEDMRQYFQKNIEIESLGRLEYGDGRIPDSTGHLLFSIDRTSKLKGGHSGEFNKSQVIMLDIGAPTDPEYPNPTAFGLYLDVWTHILEGIPGNPSSLPTIVSLSPLPAWTWDGKEQPDGRLLLAFDGSVTGNDGKTIKKGDIAIWTPEGWSYGHDGGELAITNYGKPYSPDHPGEITLHIDMSGSDVFVRIFIAVNIISWTIEA